MNRFRWIAKIAERFAVQPVVGLLGPRQCGKTTLARAYAEQHPELTITRFDLEDPLDLAALSNPRLALQDLGGLVVIDEIQRAPELFPLLRVLVDRPHNPARFLVLGSASRDLLRQSSESLAGRIGYIELTPFSLTEAGSGMQGRLWVRGGFPPVFLAESEPAGSGARITSPHFSSATSRHWESPSPPGPCTDSGRCSLIITGRSLLSGRFHNRISNYSGSELQLRQSQAKRG